MKTKNAVQIPDSHLDLLQGKALANLATLMGDGSPHVTPVWVDYDEGYVLVNSARGRQKDVNMERNQDVGLDVVDPSNPYRYLALRGRVVAIVEEGAEAHINQLSWRYTGHAFNGRAGETRRIYRIEPSWVYAAGN
jgi:PPOX class probable F420-dependent enzyme